MNPSAGASWLHYLLRQLLHLIVIGVGKSVLDALHSWLSSPDDFARPMRSVPWLGRKSKSPDSEALSHDKATTEEESSKGPGRRQSGSSSQGYFRQLLDAHPEWIEMRSNAPIFEKWLKDNPGHTEVPQSVMNGLSNVKSALRNKVRIARRKRRKPRKVAPAVVTSFAAPGGVKVTVVTRTMEALEALEEQIDDALSVAKRLGKEDLHHVVNYLRRARNAVVMILGGAASAVPTVKNPTIESRFIRLMPISDPPSEKSEEPRVIVLSDWSNRSPDELPERIAEIVGRRAQSGQLPTIIVVDDLLKSNAAHELFLSELTVAGAVVLAPQSEEEYRTIRKDPLAFVAMQMTHSAVAPPGSIPIPTRPDAYKEFGKAFTRLKPNELKEIIEGTRTDDWRYSI